MNTIWSTYIQGLGTLYNSRRLRFSDLFKKQYMNVFNIDNKDNLLEIGCGPGALAESLSRWYPDIKIYGIDRDSKFIEFAKKNNPDIDFSEGDATNLNFESNSFDVTISNTVAEHIEPSKFYREQYRVLKEKGVCIVLSARRCINIPAQCIKEQTEFEKEIWNRVNSYYKEINDKYSVCAYPQNEMELPLCMEQYGFKDVTTNYITVNLTPDNPVYSKEMAYSMINANRNGDIESIEGLVHMPTGIVSNEELEELKRITNAKYDKRIDLYNQGIKQWDTNVSVTMIIRGIKEYNTLTK